MRHAIEEGITPHNAAARCCTEPFPAWAMLGHVHYAESVYTLRLTPAYRNM